VRRWSAGRITPSVPSTPLVLSPQRTQTQFRRGFLAALTSVHQVPERQNR
jgi:hypothetical protein